MDFRRRSLRELADDVRAGRLGAREVVSHALERIEALDGALNAFVAVDGDAALEAAGRIDDAVAKGAPLGPLAGVPVGVKDLEDAAGFVTSKGSAAFAGSPPASSDSLLVARLRAAGAVVVGKTNTPELGWMADTVNRTFGATRNPWDKDRSPGGSSGGSAAAVAAGMVPLATGSDGGGSIRIPSAMCGLTGMKPSLGRIPSGGPVAPDWMDLSTRGPIARTARDVTYALDILVGPDPSDLRSLPRPDSSWRAILDDPRPPSRVVWAPTLGYAPLDDEVRRVCEGALRTLEGLGAEIVEVDTVFAEDPVMCWLTLTNLFNLRTLSRFRGTDIWEQLDPGLSAQLGWAEQISALDLVAALDRCHELNLDLVRLFHDARLLVTPTTAAPPPRSGEPGVVNGQADLNWVRFTYPFNLTRSPAATVCAGLTSDGLPVGLQLVGPQHADQVVLRSAAALEQALGLELVAAVGG